MIDVYNVSDAYINYLRDGKGFSQVYDPKVMVRKHERKYIGIVLQINGFNYFAPFSSPKSSDKLNDGSIRKSTMSIFRMVKDNSSLPGGKELLGTITINNMIPVPDSEINEYDVDSEPDLQYKNLVLDEMRWVEKNDTNIKRFCLNLYKLKINEEGKDVSKYQGTLDATLDFKELEKACNEWITDH